MKIAVHLLTHCTGTHFLAVPISVVSPGIFGFQTSGKTVARSPSSIRKDN
jgi:hypothetical protein